MVSASDSYRVIYTCLQILNEIIENAKTFRVIRLANLGQRTNLRRLKDVSVRKTTFHGTDFERDMVVAQAKFEDLTSHDIFLRPLDIVLASRC